MKRETCHTLAGLVSGRLNPHALSPPELQEVIELAPSHGLGPMLLWAAEQAGIDTTDPLWAALVASEQKNRLRYLLRTSSHAAVQAAFAAADIPCIWLKGFALAHTVYPRPTLRPMVDLDVLVPFDRRRAALATANAVGYHETEPEMFAGYHELLHHYDLYGHIEDLIKLELHFRLLGPGERLLPQAEHEWFWSQTQAVVYRDLRFTALNPEAHLLHLCAHAVLHHGETEFILLRYLDLHLLVTSTETLDWPLVLEQAVHLRWTYAVERALGYAQGYFATPLPEGLLDELRQRRPRGEAIAYATRQQPSNHWEDFLKNLRALPRSERLRFAVRTFLPSAEYLRFSYRIDADWKLPFYYVRRWLFFAKEAARTLGRWLIGRGKE